MTTSETNKTSKLYTDGLNSGSRDREDGLTHERHATPSTWVAASEDYRQGYHVGYAGPRPTTDARTSFVIGDKVRYPRGAEGTIVGVDAGVSVETKHGREWLSYTLAAVKLAKIED